jgi:hypothetical protein
MTTGIIHYTVAQLSWTGRARAVCGHFTWNFTTDPTLVSCLACQHIVRRKPQTKTDDTMRPLMTLTTALLLAAACDPNDPVSTTEQSETADIGTYDYEDASAGGDEVTSSTGATGDTETTGNTGATSADAACFGVSCYETPCPEGLYCEQHPITKLSTCVMPCGFARSCDGVVPFLCDGDVLKDVECRPEGAVSMCFPVL